MSQGSSAGRTYTFLVLHEEGRPDRVIVWDTQDLSIGRTPENDVALDHGELSRRHALLTRTRNACAVRNLSTSNGTQVNGETVAEHTLHPGDEIQMAGIRIEFHQGTRNPATLGVRLEYASQLKDFGPAGAGNADPESTVLGLMDTLTPDEDFEVRPASDFEYDLHGLDDLGPAKKARDLDLEIQAPSLDDLELPAKEESWSLDDPPAATQPRQAPQPARQPQTRPAPAPASAPQARPAPAPASAPQARPAPAPASAPQARPAPAPASAPRSRPGSSLSLHLEIRGLEGELRQRIEALLGKTLELPALTIRVEDDDLG